MTRSSRGPAFAGKPRPGERSPGHVFVDGKFFRAGEKKFFVKGVSYGPFAVDGSNNALPPREQVERDFALIREMHANTVRVYTPPPEWFLDVAAEQGLRVLIDILWPKHLCFLDSPKLQRQARETVRSVVSANRSQGHDLGAVALRATQLVGTTRDHGTVHGTV